MALDTSRCAHGGTWRGVGTGRTYPRTYRPGHRAYPDAPRRGRTGNGRARARRSPGEARWRR